MGTCPRPLHKRALGVDRQGSMRQHFHARQAPNDYDIVQISDKCGTDRGAARARINTFANTASPKSVTTPTKKQKPPSEEEKTTTPKPRQQATRHPRLLGFVAFGKAQKMLSTRRVAGTWATNGSSNAKRSGLPALPATVPQTAVGQGRRPQPRTLTFLPRTVAALGSLATSPLAA